MAPQTIGPFGTRRGRTLARRTLHRSSTVLARDPDSARAAEELGRPADLITADLAFAIEPPAPERSRDVLLNVSGLLWRENPHVDAQAYQRIIRGTIARLLAEGREVTLIAHVLDSPDPDNDVPVVRELAAESGHALDVVVPTDLDDVRTAIAGAEVLIGSRMHACLNALSVGVPAVPLAYSRKFEPLLRSVGWETGFDLRRDSPESLPARVAAAVSEANAKEARAAAARGRASLAAAVEHLQGLNVTSEHRAAARKDSSGH
jgi:polysaccharide pyruvyl transferase WcaK-like protein